VRKLLRAAENIVAGSEKYCCGQKKILLRATRYLKGVAGNVKSKI
jgi:hypothetical protein